MPARAVILNADDLGLWPSVDRGIFDAWARQAISDSSVFATAPHLPALLGEAARVGLPVGVHLNLTFGPPLSAPAEIPALVGPDGAFMKRHAWTLPLPEAQIRRELERQVQRVTASGHRPSHLDTHHHIHRYPEVLAVVIALAQAFTPPLPVRAVDADMRRALRAADLPTPDGFTQEFYADRATPKTLIQAVETCPHGILEIMTHPGYADPHLPGSYNAPRAQEFAVLTGETWRAYLTRHNIPLVGFAALREGGRP